jgi:outer membrane biosynthesis protein TonB
MPSVCELKMELKAKGIKGITGLNKAGLEALLRSKGSAPPKSSPKEAPKAKPPPAPKPAPKEAPKPPAPKPFTPAPTKVETPKVAEKPINKKAPATPKSPKMPSKAKPPPAPKAPKPPKLSEEVETNRFELMQELPKCRGYFKKANITSDDELRKYLIRNHPDKKNYKNKEEEELYKEISNCYSVVKELNKGSGKLNNIYL